MARILIKIQEFSRVTTDTNIELNSINNQRENKCITTDANQIFSYHVNIILMSIKSLTHII